MVISAICGRVVGSWSSPSGPKEILVIFHYIYVTFFPAVLLPVMSLILWYC